MKLDKLSKSLLLIENQNNPKLLQILDNISKVINIPIYIIGGMAVAQHGYSRYTNDIDILINTKDADNFIREISKRNFKPVGSNSFTNGNMIINICTPDIKAGDVKFPSLPSNKPGLKVIDLPILLKMKIEANRYKDRADFVELVKANNLNGNYIEKNVLPLLSSKMSKKLAIALHNRALVEHKMETK